MGKSAPKAPDPWETASAQGAWNSFTAQQQQQMNMVGQNTPWGSLDYDESGSTWIIDPNGKRVEIPSYTANVNLTPEQQEILNRSQQAESNLAQIAQDQSEWLQSYLGGQIDTSGAPEMSVPSDIDTPDLQTGLGDAGDITQSYGTDYEADLQHELGDAGDVTRTYGTDYSANVQEVQDALMQRMQPQMQQDQDQLRTQLINSGLRPGTSAWNSEMERMSRQHSDARLGAVLSAGQEQSRLAGLAQQQAQFQNAAQQQAFGQEFARGQFANAAQQQAFQQGIQADMSEAQRAQFQNAAQQQQFQQGLQGAGFANTAAQQGFQNEMGQSAAQNQARQQAINEQFGMRNQPLNELIGLMGMSQVQNPTQSFTQTPQSGVAGVDYTGLVNQKYQADLANYQAGMGGLFGLGSALIGALPFSDERLKTDLRKVGETDGGTPIYTFRYKGDPVAHMGVLAQDVPEARVVDPETGFYRVNYERVH